MLGYAFEHTRECVKFRPKHLNILLGARLSHQNWTLATQFSCTISTSNLQWIAIKHA